MDDDRPVRNAAVPSARGRSEGIAMTTSARAAASLSASADRTGRRSRQAKAFTCQSRMPMVEFGSDSDSRPT